jgi:hypothetical protein
MHPSCSSPPSSWASRLRPPLRLLALLVSLGLLAPTAWAQPEPRPRHRWDVGFDLIGLWGADIRLGWERDRGAIDMLGLRAGWVAGPSPVFGSERTLAAAFVAPVVDLFAEEEWQLELTAGPAALHRDPRGEAALAFDGTRGWVTGLAARYKTPGWFQINLGLMMIADARFRERVVVVDIGPAWVW